MLAANEILQGRYRVTRPLGRGGMGAVYEAFDLRLSRTVAVKETFAESADLLRAFQREARLLANLRHPALPNILDHFVEGDGQFLVMEYIAGHDLAQMLARRGTPFPVPDVLRWADELLAVVEYLHDHRPPVIHRDIKPANLKLGPEGQIILLDFGLAKGSAGGMTTTVAGRSVAGYSPHYAPLEQTYGDKSDSRSDLYAVAATLYHLVTGHVPEEAAHRASASISGEADPLLPASRRHPAVPAQLSNILERALSLKPQERPGSAAEVRASLREVFPDTHINTSRAKPHSAIRRGAPQETVYPTIPVKPELVVDPFNVSASKSVPEVNNSKVRWAFTAFLICALAAGIYLFYLSGQTEVKPANLRSASQPVKPVIPSPYREALGSVVSLELRDAAGNPTGHGCGFFVREDQVATDLSVIRGATSGRVISPNGDAFEIASASAVDRQRGVVILQIKGARAKPLPVVSRPATNDVGQAAVLSTTADRESNYAPTTITSHDQRDDVEVGGAVDSAARGAPVVNDKGEVVAIIVSPPVGTGNTRAVASAALFSLTKAKQPATSLGVAGANELLYDFRRQENTETEKSKISAEEQEMVLSAVFDSYLTNSNQCRDFEGNTSTPEGLKEARELGNIVPEISDKATGSFTRPGMQQSAYLIWVGECGAAHVVNWGTKRLAIFTGQQLSLNVDVQDHTAILGTYDMNGDGVHELLVTGGYAQSGLITEWGALVSVKDGRLRFDRRLETVRESTCASMDPKPSVTAALIYYTHGAVGKSPEIRVDNYQAKCTENDSENPSPDAFRYISSGQPPKS